MSFEISSVVVGSGVLVVSVVCDGTVASDCCTVFVSISSTALVASVVLGVVTSGCCTVFVSDVSFVASVVGTSGGTCVTVTLSVIGDDTVVSGVSLAVCRF